MLLPRSCIKTARKVDPAFITERYSISQVTPPPVKNAGDIHNSVML